MTILNTDKLKRDYFLDNLNSVKFQIRVGDDGGKWIDWDLPIEELNSDNIWCGDIRIKPIKDFEIGDWVCDINNRIDRDIRIITKGLIEYYNGKNYIAQERYAEQWFPKENEYMWFYNSIYQYHFGRYFKSTTDIADQVFHYSKEKGTGFEFVEPFTKQIPLFLKGE
jgi:hypothetical protein